MKNTAFLTLFVIGLAVGSRLEGQTALNPNPSRALGQPQLQIRSVSPNVPEGREFLSPWSVAIDSSGTPRAIYVADFGNNRVLGWRNSATFANGAPADIVVGQVDKTSTLPLGPGTPRNNGFNSPAAVAVDANGNLYVADAGNNRILRFPKPFATEDEIKNPDMVIGQRNFTTREPNSNGISASAIALSSGSSVARTGMAFDSAGNLWFSDALNNRVLRFPKSVLDAGANGPAADLVLGQTGFTEREPLDAAPDAALNKSRLRTPSAIAVDDRGRVYVADAFFRVLAFQPPFFPGSPASRILGVRPVTTPPSPLPVTEYNFANVQNQLPPEGLFIAGNRLGVVDTGNHRILLYDPFEQWEPEQENRVSPPAKIVIGQSDFLSRGRNRGQSEPSASSLNDPLGAAFAGGELFIADSANHRVLVFPQQTTAAAATRVLGQVDFSFGAPNLIEGREMFLFNGFASGGADGGGIALDTRSNPPRLYVSDTYNNRVLGYRDARIVRPGDKADIVIGQNDFNRNLINAPQGQNDVVTPSGLNRPAGIAVDSQGNLWVADAGNGRLLRFPSPFEQNIPPGQRHTPTVVLGQANFNTKTTDASARNMAYPFGVVLTVEGSIVVSDATHARVLFFRRPAGGDFTNGMAASWVLGQTDFLTVGRQTTNPNSVASPRHMAIDTDDRLYVADPALNRVTIYDRVSRTDAVNNPAPSFTLTNLGSPQAVWVSPHTAEIWIAERNGARRYPRFDRLFTNTASDYQVNTNTPLAITQDQLGNLYVAEGINRVAIYFNGLVHQNAANFNEVSPVSPGAIVSIYPRGQNARFGEDTASFSALPLPKTLADVQVLVNDAPAPLYFVSPGQINFLMPMNTPVSGFAEVQVMRASTGQILAAFGLPLAPVSPGLFVNVPASGGGGQLAALNEDNTVNSPGNPIPRGRVIQLFGTGQGFVSNAPPDGSPPSGPIDTDERPRVIINTGFVPDDHILYSGLAPSLVGVWQLNVRVPELTPPSNTVDVAVVLRSSPSNRGPQDRIIRTTIAVRQ